MSDIRLSARTTLGVLGSWIQTISGNLTGAQLYGYKGTRLSFGDSLVTQLRDGGPSGASGGTNAIQVPSGSIAIGSTVTDFRQGGIVPTGNDHHLAISGSGWFAVADPAGTITYTRNGEFHVDDAGNLVDATGNFVLGVFDDTKGLVLTDGTSFVDPGPLPVLTAADGALGRVAVGSTNLAGAVPVSRDTVLGQTVTAGDISTVLGTGVNALAPNGTPVATATVSNPFGVTTDADGNLYYTDGTSTATHRRVRMVPKQDGTYFGIPMLANRVYTIVGNGGVVWAGEGSLPTATGLVDVNTVALDANGNMLLADNDRIVFIPRQDGTYFGRPMLANRAYTLADTSSIPAGAAFSAATFDPDGHVSFTTTGAIIPVPIATNVFMIPHTDGTYYGQVMTTGTATVIAGTNSNGHGGNGVPATASAIRAPHGVSFDAEGNFYFNDSWRIRMVPRQDGVYFGQKMQANHVYSIAGFSGALPPSDDEPATSTGLGSVTNFSLDPAGNLYIGGNTGSNVYMVPRYDGRYYGRDMQANWIYRIAGSDSDGYSGDGGPAASAELNLFIGSGVWADGLGVWVADTENRRIRYIPAFDSADGTGDGLYTFLDQPDTGAQDRSVATRYLEPGPITIGLQRHGTDLPLLTITSVDGRDVPITISLSDANNRASNTAYDNARLIADAINARSNETGVAVSIVRDRKDATGKVALVMGHVQRTLSEAYIDFTDPENPAADLQRTGAGILETLTDTQGNRYHRVNVMTLTATAPSYRPQPGDRITFDATGQMVNLSRGATATSSPPFATGVHVALADPANAAGLQKTAGSSRFVYTDAAGSMQTGFAGQERQSQIGALGIQVSGRSTIGMQNALRSQSLESSNTSITDQLPELTIAQKVFTSTTKLVSVGNSLIEDLNGLIR
jgi:flagellar hook-basal body protein